MGRTILAVAVALTGIVGATILAKRRVAEAPSGSVVLAYDPRQQRADRVLAWSGGVLISLVAIAAYVLLIWGAYSMAQHGLTLLGQPGAGLWCLSTIAVWVVVFALPLLIVAPHGPLKAFGR